MHCVTVCSFEDFSVLTTASQPQKRRSSYGMERCLWMSAPPENMLPDMPASRVTFHSINYLNSLIRSNVLVSPLYLSVHRAHGRSTQQISLAKQGSRLTTQEVGRRCANNPRHSGALMYRVPRLFFLHDLRAVRYRTMMSGRFTTVPPRSSMRTVYIPAGSGRPLSSVVGQWMLPCACV